MNETGLAIRSEMSLDEVERAANAMTKSGYFQDAKDVNQAIVKILAGREIGFGPFASMNGVYIIQGRPSFGANLMAAAVKKSGRYDYRVLEMTDQACELEFYQQGKPIGKSRFTLEDAKKAQTKNLDKFPRNMLFARAMSNGVRWYTPDIFNGATVYTPEELGAETTEDGTVTVMPIEIKPTAPAAPVKSASEFDAIKPWTNTVVTLGMAMNEKSSEKAADGSFITYWSMPTEKLTVRWNSITKKIKDNGLSPEDHETYQIKADVLKAIIDYRNQ